MFFRFRVEMSRESRGSRGRKADFLGEKFLLVSCYPIISLSHAILHQRNCKKPAFVSA
jgi:hypothetical protein